MTTFHPPDAPPMNFAGRKKRHRLIEQPKCPKCDGTMWSNGMTGGVVYYKCRSCGHTKPQTRVIGK